MKVRLRGGSPLPHRGEQASPPPAVLHVCRAGLPRGPPLSSFASLSAGSFLLCWLSSAGGLRGRPGEQFDFAFLL